MHYVENMFENGEDDGWVRAMSFLRKLKD